VPAAGRRRRPEALAAARQQADAGSGRHDGTLPNGLRYYVRTNGVPEHRVQFRLAVKTGSVFEADDQRGLAHMLEHMAFNGTAHFKPDELVNYFESAGARFGAHVNAQTSFDDTIYMLQVASDRPGLVDKALLRGDSPAA
jgi:zinc protease